MVGICSTLSWPGVVSLQSLSFGSIRVASQCNNCRSYSSPPSRSNWFNAPIVSTSYSRLQCKLLYLLLRVIAHLFHSASLPVILSLLSLWLVLFLFFAILYVEVFSMTKWASGESRNQNYSSMPNALLMLAFMTTGCVGSSLQAKWILILRTERGGTNTCMTSECPSRASCMPLLTIGSSAIVYPKCTNSSGFNTDSDCGSVGWAFTLFIAWNLLSMVRRRCHALLLSFTETICSISSPTCSLVS